MEGVEARSSVVQSGDGGVRVGQGGKGTVELSQRGGAVVENGQTKEWLLLEVNGGLRLSLGRLLEVIHLPPRHQRHGVDVVEFGQGDVVVGLGIGAVLGRVKILHEVGVAQLGDVGRGVDIVGKVELLLVPDAVAAVVGGGRDRVLELRGIGVVGVVGEEVAYVAVVFPEFQVGVESGGVPVECPVILADGGKESIPLAHGKGVGGEQESAPLGVVSRGELKSLMRETRVGIGKPEDGDPADIKRGIEQDHAVIGINPDRPCADMPTRL